MFAILSFLNSSANFKQSIFIIIHIFIIQTTFKNFDKLIKEAKPICPHMRTTKSKTQSKSKNFKKLHTQNITFGRVSWHGIWDDKYIDFFK
jgi:hypothetical protein